MAGDIKPTMCLGQKKNVLSMGSITIKNINTTTLDKQITIGRLAKYKLSL